MFRNHESAESGVRGRGNGRLMSGMLGTRSPDAARVVFLDNRGIR
jgi:hypothetical protein